MDYNFPLGIGVSRCANGETHEFYFTFNSTRLEGLNVSRSVRQGESMLSHAEKAVYQLIRKEMIRREAHGENQVLNRPVR